MAFVSHLTSPAIVTMQSVVVFDLLKYSFGLLATGIDAADPVPRKVPTRRRKVPFEQIVEGFNSQDFKRAFRVSKEQFAILHAKLEPIMTKNEEMGRRAGRQIVPSDSRLAATLRMLAGASYLDIMIGFNVGRSTAYAMFHETRRAISKVLQLPGLPNTLNELEELSMGFKHSRKHMSPFTGCVGAIDGIAIRIKKPSCRYAAAYYNRKGYYCLPVQALVDSRYRFLDLSIRCVGSTHDALAHSVSRLGKYLAEKNLPLEYWIVGDEAYVCTESLISPIPHAQVRYSWEDGFNFFLSSLRIHVEQAFGMLVARWRILNKIDYSVKTGCEIVSVCMKLHNFCIENKAVNVKDVTEEEVCQRNEDVQAWFAACKERSWVEDDAGAVNSVMSYKRTDMVALAKLKGLKRPGVVGSSVHFLDIDYTAQE